MNSLIDTLLAERDAATLLVIADDVPGAIARYGASAPDRVVTTLAPHTAMDTLAADARRYDYAVLWGVLEVLPVAEARGLIARVRDVHCPAFLLVSDLDAAPGWDHSGLLAMALTKIEAPAVGPAAYAFDIDSYNRRREWNSPDHWANPENFDRYRW